MVRPSMPFLQVLMERGKRRELPPPEFACTVTPRVALRKAEGDSSTADLLPLTARI